MNELQIAFQHSCLTQTNNQVSFPFDMFAVVYEGIAHCPITDAILPNPFRAVVALYGSRRVAEYHANKLIAQAVAAEDYEGGYVVFPKLPRPRLPAPSYDEIPF